MQGRKPLSIQRQRGMREIDWTQYMALPALLLFATFFVYPLIRGIGMSLTDWDGMGEATFVGFANFTRFFQDARAMGDIRTTLIFAAGSAILLNLVGLLYALLMEKPFHAAGIFEHYPAVFGVAEHRHIAKRLDRHARRVDFAVCGRRHLRQHVFPKRPYGRAAKRTGRGGSYGRRRAHVYEIIKNE